MFRYGPLTTIWAAGSKTGGGSPRMSTSVAPHRPGVCRPLRPDIKAYHDVRQSVRAWMGRKFFYGSDRQSESALERPKSFEGFSLVRNRFTALWQATGTWT